MKKLLTILSFVLITTMFLFCGCSNKSNESKTELTDDEKINQSVQFYNEGKLEDAKNSLSDVYTVQANVIKIFLEVEDNKVNFVSAFEKDSSDLTELYNTFVASVEEFKENNELYYLSDTMKQDFVCYETAIAYVTDYVGRDTEDSLYSALYDVQSIMLNWIDMYNSKLDGTFFTLNQLQMRVDAASYALDILNSYELDEIVISNENVIKNCYMPTSKAYGVEKGQIKTTYYLNGIYSNLKDECRSAIYSLEDLIEESSEGRGMYDELYISPDSDWDLEEVWGDYVAIEGGYTWSGYKTFVGGYLETIKDIEDITKNRDTIINRLEAEILYCMVSGKLPNRQ